MKPKSNVKCWWRVHIDQLNALLCSHVLLLLFQHDIQSGSLLLPALSEAPLAGWMLQTPAADFPSAGHRCFGGLKGGGGGRGGRAVLG